jgi:signal transduction histidine kinase
LIGRLFVIYDITERKQVQREYMKQQWKLAVNEEREKLARDMHDNLGQVLGFINLQAQGIRQELSNAGIEIALPELDRLVKVTQSAQQEIREYIRNTRSSAAIENNFSTALTKDIMNFEEQTGLMIELDIPKGFTGEELELNVRLNLLSIIKEALNNIRKHAEAEHVKIAFSFEGNQLWATVEDDGKGFDIVRHNHETKTKFGLDIMHERATQIGAQLEIISAAGQGTRIDFHMPINGGKKKNADEADAGR